MSAEKCPMCGHHSTRLVIQQEVDGEIFKVLQCMNDICKHGFVSPLPNFNFLASMYSQTNLNSYLTAEQSMKSVVSFYESIIHRHLKKYFELNTSRISLDIGCGTGTLCTVLRDLGFVVDGIDFNEESIKFAKEIYGLDLKVGSMYELEKYFPSQTYDLITMTHVLEHVLNPREYIAYLTKFLRPNGLILISVPNINSDDYLSQGEKWSYIHIPAHISYFSEASLDSIFNNCYNIGDTSYGFDKLFASTFPGPFQKQGEGLTALYRFMKLSSKNKSSFIYNCFLKKIYKHIF